MSGDGDNAVAKRGGPYAGKIKTPAGHASRGLEIRFITQEGTYRPSRAGKASNVVMVVMEDHVIVSLKKARMWNRGKIFFQPAAGPRTRAP